MAKQWRKDAAVGTEGTVEASPISVDITYSNQMGGIESNLILSLNVQAITSTATAVLKATEGMMAG
jgi:hypothetical protein